MLTSEEKRELAEVFAEVADGLERLDADPWTIELAPFVLAMVAHPDAPAELAEMLVAEIAGRANEPAAAVLKAMERLAHPPLRDRAREAAAELARRGVASSVEDEIGNLRVQEAAILSVDREEVALICLLQRPSAPDLALTVLAFMEPGTDALVEIRTSEPEPLADARTRFEVNPAGGKRRGATRQEALELLTRAVHAGEPLLDEMLYDVAILERGLTGEDMRLARPPIFPEEDPEGEEAEGLAGRLVEQMVAEGVDPGDPDALAAWMEDYNARSYEERVAITGDLPRPAGPSGKKRKQRRQAKAARRKNRRR